MTRHGFDKSTRDAAGMNGSPATSCEGGDDRHARYVKCDCDLGCNVCDPPPADWGEQANCVKNGPMCWSR